MWSFPHLHSVVLMLLCFTFSPFRWEIKRKSQRKGMMRRRILAGKERARYGKTRRRLLFLLFNSIKFSLVADRWRHWQFLVATFSCCSSSLSCTKQTDRQTDVCWLLLLLLTAAFVVDHHQSFDIGAGPFDVIRQVQASCAVSAASAAAEGIAAPLFKTNCPLDFKSSTQQQQQ